MPRPSKGARLWWRDESRKSDGSLRSKAGWFIRDGSRVISTGCGQGESEAAERRLADYISEKYEPDRRPAQVPENAFVADVVSIYLVDVAPGHARPKDTADRLDRILDHFGTMTLRQINGRVCRDYAKSRTTKAAARRELEDLRSAINHYRKEGYCLAVPAVPMPEKSQPRERWLERGEAARLLWAAWRMTQKWKGQESRRRTGMHLARFMLVALYTGTRSAAICGAAIRPTPERGFVDLERGVFYRRAASARATKKRQPAVRIPPRLLAHLRRWERLGIAKDYVVEWNGRPVQSVKKSFKTARRIAGLDDAVTPHVFRHTAATWLMQAGADLWDAAGYLGMTVETLERTYGHHHPGHLAGAVEAIAASPQNPHRKAGNKREHGPANVVRMTGKQRAVN